MPSDYQWPTLLIAKIAHCSQTLTLCTVTEEALVRFITVDFNALAQRRNLHTARLTGETQVQHQSQTVYILKMQECSVLVVSEKNINLRMKMCLLASPLCRECSQIE